jgi:hypothetical protein
MQLILKTLDVEDTSMRIYFSMNTIITIILYS